jgi:hypothetical protein
VDVGMVMVLAFQSFACKGTYLWEDLMDEACRISMGISYLHLCRKA